MREGDDDMDEDEERVDMSAINGAKEREERREKFYSVQQECMLLIFMIQIEDYAPPSLPHDARHFVDVLVHLMNRNNYFLHKFCLYRLRR